MRNALLHMYVLITTEAKDRHRAREGERREREGERERAAARGDVREGGAKVKRGESSM